MIGSGLTIQDGEGAQSCLGEELSVKPGRMCGDDDDNNNNNNNNTNTNNITKAGAIIVIQKVC